MTEKQSRYILAQAANAAERIATTLERFSRAEANEIRAEQLEIAASDLAHYENPIPEASGITAATAAKMAARIANPSPP